jgi:autoinducer 2-degrading protein
VEICCHSCTQERCIIWVNTYKEDGVMHIVHVFIHVKNEQVEEFKTATVKNAEGSLQEPGIARFDLIQQADDPTHFLLVEVYRTSEDPARHKETPHYKHWHATVQPMMAEPRTHITYRNVFPDESGWG